MNEIRINPAELDGLLQMLADFPDVTRAELANAADESTLLLERNIKQHTPKGAGGAAGLSGSIAAHPATVTAGEITGKVGTPLQHAIPVELGTKPHFPPLEPLEDWVRAKLDVDDSQVSSVAYLIARKISVRGTEGAHMFERGFEESEAAINHIFNQVPGRVLQRVGAA